MIVQAPGAIKPARRDGYRFAGLKSKSYARLDHRHPVVRLSPLGDEGLFVPEAAEPYKTLPPRYGTPNMSLMNEC